MESAAWLRAVALTGIVLFVALTGAALLIRPICAELEATGTNALGTVGIG